MSSTACDDQLTVHPEDARTKRHKWADVIIAIANGEAVEWRAFGGWELFEPYRHNSPIESTGGIEWRIKPRTITIAGIEVTEPVRKAPELGTQYYIANSLGDCLALGFLWSGDRNDKDFLRRGMAHLTKEAAIAHAKALIAVSGGTA